MRVLIASSQELIQKRLQLLQLQPGEAAADGLLQRLLISRTRLHSFNVRSQIRIVVLKMGTNSGRLNGKAHLNVRRRQVVAAKPASGIQARLHEVEIALHVCVLVPVSNLLRNAFRNGLHEKGHRCRLDPTNN